MTIRNITGSTLAITLFGHNYEIPAGWSLSSEEVWGGEETLRYVAVKFVGKVRVFDGEGNEIESIKCPGCGHEVEIPPKEDIGSQPPSDQPSITPKVGGRKVK